MKNKKIWIGIVGLLTVIIIGLAITVAMLLIKNKKEDSRTSEKPKKTVEETVTVDEEHETKSKKERASYICDLDIPKEKVTENGNPYSFNEEYLGWYENQYGAFHLKQIDGENILTDFYVLGYKFLQDYSVAIMSEDTFDLTYNQDKANGVASTESNITINEKDGEIRFFIEDRDSAEHFLEYSLGQSQGMFQELMNYNDVKTEFNLKWYFYGKFTKKEPPETYKEISTFSADLYDFETGEFIAENTQPVNNREIKERFPKLAKHLPQENWYYTGDLDNKKEVSLIYISTSNESYNGFTNFGLKFVQPSNRDSNTDEYILHMADDYRNADSFSIFTAYNVEDNEFHCLAKEGQTDSIIPRGEVESGETVHSTKKDFVDQGSQTASSTTSKVSNVTLYSVYYKCTVNEDGTLLLESDDWEKVIKIFDNCSFEEKQKSKLYQSKPTKAVYTPVSEDELREKGYIL